MQRQSHANDGLKWNLIVLIVLAFLAACFSAPNLDALQSGGLPGKNLHQDTSYHLMRLESIVDGLRGGQFPVYVYPNTLNGYGYGSPLFYPDLFFYLPASWMLLGMSLPTAYVLFVGLVAFAAMGAYYLFARKVLCNRVLALLSAGLYLGGNYLYSVFFYMNAVGQACAACFAPVLLLGIYNMIKEDFSRPWILLVGVLGITFSHTISLFLWGIFLVVIVLVHAKKLMGDKRWWAKVGIIFFAYLCISSAYFLPMLEQLSAAKFYQMAHPWATLSKTATDIRFLFFRSSDYPLTMRIVEYSIGILVPVTYLLRPFIKKTESNKKTLRSIDWLIAWTIGSALCTTNLFPWVLLDKTIFNSVQFPSRLLMITSAFTPLTVILLLREFASSPRFRFGKGVRLLRPQTLCAAMGVAFLAFSVGFNVFFLPPEEKVSLELQDLYAYVGGGEWYPVGKDAYASDGTVYVANTSKADLTTNGVKVPYERAENTLTIIWEGKGGKEYILPLLWYKGYVAYDEAGNELTIEQDGYAKVKVRAVTDGSISVSYAGTAVQKWTLPVSVLSSIVTAGGFLVAEWRKRKVR
ncbi:MAG: hypothetical protein ACI4U2_01140 [Christensenellaceae bacterium]